MGPVMVYGRPCDRDRTGPDAMPTGYMAPICGWSVADRRPPAGR